MTFRKPGEKLLAGPDKVWQELSCDKQTLPHFVVEKNEVLPDTVSAGHEFNHRLVYSLCPSKPTEVFPGKLLREIHVKEKPVFQDAPADIELKAGRWTVDSFVRVPPDAPAGVYSLVVRFEEPRLGFEKEKSFVVEKRAR
ncbi:MAG: hypothetical protein ACREBC_31860 [Pyrinomonadaceae bacterium]